MSVVALLLLSSAIGSAAESVRNQSMQLIYAETQRNVTTVWRVSPDRLTEREELLRIDHVPAWDPAVSMSPDGKRFAAIAVTAGTPARALRTSVLLADAVTREIHEIDVDADIHISPTWIGNDSFVYLKAVDSSLGDQRLDVVQATVRTGEHRTVAQTDGFALLPVHGGMPRDISDIFWYRVSSAGREFVTIDGERQTFLTRWPVTSDVPTGAQMAPDQSRIAYVTKRPGPIDEGELIVINLSGAKVQQEYRGRLGTRGNRLVWSDDSRVLAGTEVLDVRKTKSDEVGGSLDSPIWVVEPPIGFGAGYPLGESPDHRFRVYRWHSDQGDTVTVHTNPSRAGGAPSVSDRIPASGWVNFLGWSTTNTVLHMLPPPRAEATCPVAAVFGLQPLPTTLISSFDQAAANALGTSGPSIGNLSKGVPPNSVSVPFSAPKSIMKAMGWFESTGWLQFHASYGGFGNTVISFDCGYGVMQITSGMSGGAGFDPSRVAGEPTYNIGTGALFVHDKWQGESGYIGSRDPAVYEDWYYTVWDYNSGGSVNNPSNPVFPNPFPVYNGSNRSQMPYQEGVWSLIRNPQAAGATYNNALLWDVIAVTSPSRGVIPYPTSPKPSIATPLPAHADSGSGQAPGILTTPPPGSTLSGASATFGWTPGSGVSQYFLYVGTTVGGNDLYGLSEGINLSVTVSGLPTDGRTLYVRLWSMLGGVWQFNDYTYTAAVAQSCYSLTLVRNPSNGGSISANPTGSIPCNWGYYLNGTQISLTATAASGYQFNGWTGSGGSFSTMSQPSTTFTIAGTAQVTANFVSAPTTGTINVNATLGGGSWSGPINLSVNGPTFAGFGQVPGSVSSESPGSYTATYNSLGPAGSSLSSITPSATQTLSAGGAITFTVNFISPTQNPVPSISSVSPSGVTAGGSGFVLSVFGSSFIPQSVVYWNGSQRQTSYVSSGDVTAVINAGDIASQGSATVTVVNPAPGGGTSGGATVTIQPSVGQCAPTSVASCPFSVNRSLTTFSCTGGKRGSGNYTDVFSFAGTQGASVVIDLTSSSFDTYLYLVAPDGTIFAFNDDSNNTTNSQILATLSVAGTWTVEATSHSQGTTGGYTLSLSGCGGGSLATPTGLVVTYNHTFAGVNLNWNGVANAVDYEGEINSSQILDLQTSGTAQGVKGLGEPVCYSVRVRAVDASGQRSGWSSRDIATSIIFSEDPLVSGVTVARAVHSIELRAAVATVRSAAGLLPFSFTNAIASGNIIRAIDVLELRNALNGARNTLGMSAVVFPDPVAGVTIIHASDIQRLRDAMK